VRQAALNKHNEEAEVRNAHVLFAIESGVQCKICKKKQAWGQMTTLAKTVCMTLVQALEIQGGAASSSSTVVIPCAEEIRRNAKRKHEVAATETRKKRKR
jgi:hypothetical protein